MTDTEKDLELFIAALDGKDIADMAGIVAEIRPLFHSEWLRGMTDEQIIGVFWPTQENIDRHAANRPY